MSDSIKFVCYPSPLRLVLGCILCCSLCQLSFPVRPGYNHSRATVITSLDGYTKPPHLYNMSFENYCHAGEAQFRKPLHPFLEILDAVSSAEPAIHIRGSRGGNLVISSSRHQFFQEILGYSLIDYGKFTANLRYKGHHRS